MVARDRLTLPRRFRDAMIPSPLRGGGRGWGCALGDCNEGEGDGQQRADTPTPDPFPQGEGEVRIRRGIGLGSRSCLTVALVVATMLPAAVSSAQTVACDVKLNVTDQDPAGLNVRASPGGAVVTALKARNRWVQVQVTGQSGEWARIDRATFISEDNAGGTAIFRGLGWVAFSKLGIEELNQQALILAEPKDGARTVLKISEGDEANVPKAEVLGCDGLYLKVRVKGLVGWTQNYCSNQFTTCV